MSPSEALNKGAPSRSANSTARLVWCVALIFPIGLLLDTIGGLVGTLVVSVATWWLLALVWLRADRASRRALIVCVLWATAGEVFMTEAWGLYEYRFGFVPPFVPPGHALLFQCGVWATARMTESTRALLRWLAVPVTLVGYLCFRDELSLAFLAVFLFLLRFGRSPEIYGTMFFLALLLELMGTALGTWVWTLRVPGVGLTTCNPPVAAGVFYCCLDAVTLGRRKRDHANTMCGAKPTV